MVLAYKAEYEHNEKITIAQLLVKYSITLEDLPGHETWQKLGAKAEIPKTIAIKKPRKQKPIDKILANTSIDTIVPKTTTPPVDTPEEETQQDKIESFKKLALDYCVNFMHKDAKFAEVKEFKDIVAIVDSLEKSYQKTDPEAGKPTINILIQNLMERFEDDC